MCTLSLWAPVSVDLSDLVLIFVLLPPCPVEVLTPMQVRDQLLLTIAVEWPRYEFQKPIDLVGLVPGSLDIHNVQIGGVILPYILR